MSDKITTFNIKEAAKFLGIHQETLRRLAAASQIPGVKIGRAWRFILQDLAAYLRANYVTAANYSTVNYLKSNKTWPLLNEKTSGGL